MCGTLTSSSKVRPSPLPEMAQPKDKISSREVPMDECCKSQYYITLILNYCLKAII